MAHLDGLSVALLKDLLDDIVIVGGTELVLKGGLGSGIVGTLSTLAVKRLASRSYT